MSEPAAWASASLIISTGAILSVLMAATFVPAGAGLYWRARDYKGKAKAMTPRPPGIPLNWRTLLGDVFKIIGLALTAGPLAAILGKRAQPMRSNLGTPRQPAPYTIRDGIR